MSKILVIPIILITQVYAQTSNRVGLPDLHCTVSAGLVVGNIKTIAEAFTIGNCVDPYPADIGERERAQIDKKVCECTKGNPLMLNLKPFQGLIDNSTLKVYETQERETAMEILKARTSAALDASILFEGDEKIIGDLMTNDKYIQATVKDYLREKEKEKIELLRDKGALSKSDYRDVIRTIQNKFYGVEEKDKQGSENVHSLKSFFDQGQISDGQCITYREYHGFKQLPTDDDFMDEIISEKEFDETKWNYPALVNQYNKLEDAGKTTTSEFLRLKSRIVFLNRNPMMRHLFNSNYRKKKEIFAALKEFSASKCNEGTLYLGKLDPHVEKYKNKLKDLVGNAEAQGIIKKSIDQEIKNTLNVSLDQKGAPVRKHKSRQDVITYLEELYKTSPATCRSSDKSGCLVAYRQYCEEIKSVPDEGVNNNGESLKSILRGDFITDFDKNADLKRVNDLFCNTRLKKDPNNPTERGYTFNEYRAEFCSGENVIECRTTFLKQYGKSFENPETIKIGNFLDSVIIKNVASNKIENITAGKGSTFSDKKGFDWDTYRRDNGISGGSMAGDLASPKIASNSGGTGGTLASGIMNPVQQNPVNPNFYSNVSIPSQSKVHTNEDSSVKERSISELSPQEQYSLLNEWKRELNEARSRKSDGEAMSSGDKLLQERIAALENLLLQQKTLSDRQYALLNEALKSKDNELKEQVAKAEKKSQEKVTGTHSGFDSSSSFAEQGFNRAPASVRGNTASGIQGGSSAGDSARLASSSQEAQALRDSSSRESLAREEAKLVNLRQESSGAIVLEGTKQGVGANAIAVSISDEAYKLARTSLIGINLQQIEKNIPKDQIELLEKNGVITLILQNGQNPPLEVKVKRLNGSLVQVENTEAIVRKFSLQSLQNTFRE